MTEQDYIDLSKRVAEKLEIEPSYTDDGGWDEVWLYQDRARCFELACEYILIIGICKEFVSINAERSPLFIRTELLKNHNNDRSLAARVAVLRALEAM